MVILISTVVGTALTLVIAVAAVMTLRQGRRQADLGAVEATSRVSDYENAVALAPRYDVTLVAANSSADRMALDLLHLNVIFTGPADLDHLDQLDVVLGCHDYPTKRSASFRFQSGTRPRTDDRGADSKGLVSRCGRVEGGEQLQFQLERTAPAHRRERLVVTLHAYRLSGELDLPSVGQGSMHWSRTAEFRLATVRSL
jgi:hypothetical protein